MLEILDASPGFAVAGMSFENLINKEIIDHDMSDLIYHRIYNSENR